MAGRTEEEITVELTNAIATSPKRSGRARKPSAKARYALRLGNDTSGTSGIESDGETEDEKALLPTLLALLASSRDEIRSLKDLISAQQSTIRNLDGEVKDVKEELKQVREHLEEISNGTGFQTNTQSSPRASYADIARTPPTSHPSNIRTASTGAATLYSDILFCTIDTSRVERSDGENMSAGSIRKALEKEIRSMKDHEDWRCRAVTVDPRNSERIKIACRDEAEHQMVKRTAEAIATRGARVLRDELYPIKVDNVRRTAVLDETGAVRSGVTEAFGQENETTVAKVVWLSRKDVAKAYGSMVVYLTKAAEARRFLSEGFFYAGGESGYTGVFERRNRPEQCYNCQQIGHKAFQCKQPEVCGRCAKIGHSHRSCEESIPKCVPCGGPHESFSRNCPKLYPSRHE